MFDIKEGFDVVIGNPPYIEFKNLAVSIKNTLKGYKSTTGKYDLYIPFIEKGITVLKSKGLLVFINPTRFLSRDYGNGLKKFILEHSHIKEILDFSDVQIFENATTYTGIFQLTKNITNDQKTKIKTVTNKFKNIGIKDFSDSQMEVTYISQKLLDPSQPWYFKTSFVNKVCDEINAIGKPLENICDGIFQGVSTGKDEVFVITNIDIEKYNLEKEILIPFLKGKDIGPYDIKWSGNYVIYPYDNQGKVMSENHLSINYPNVLEYLKENRHKLKGRGYFDKSNKLWFELWNQRNIKRFSQKKIVTLDNASQNSFAIDRDNFLGTTTTYSIVLKQELQCFYETILIQLNSSLLNFYHKHNTIPQSGGFFRYQSAFIKGLPVYLGLSSEIGKILYSFTMKHREIGQSINDAVVFNIYFSDHMRERNIDVLKFIEQNIENILQGKEFEKISEDEKENVIEQLHTIWTNPNNEVVKRMSMFRKKSPDILGVILDS